MSNIIIESWTSLSHWKWEVNDDLCGICRLQFEGCCPECKLPGDDCPLIWGVCTHCFHLHCLMKWLTNQQKCPMCRGDWECA